MSDDNCLDAASPDGPVKLVRCHGMGGNQAWVYNDEDKTIRHMNTNKCLSTQVFFSKLFFKKFVKSYADKNSIATFKNVTQFVTKV